MFNYNVRGENIEVTKAIRDYAEKKVSKLERFFDNAPDATAYVNLKVYPDKTAKAEVTIPLSFLVLRAEETNPDLYASIDLVVDKLERQVRVEGRIEKLDAAASDEYFERRPYPAFGRSHQCIG